MMLDVKELPTLQANSAADLFYSWKERCFTVYISNDPSSLGGPTSGIVMQEEARRFFASFGSLASNKNREFSMASLIQTLEPCFDSITALSTKYLALFCLVGSVQGCLDNAEESQTIPILSLSLVKLLSTFFLLFAAPIDSKSNLDTDIETMGKDIGNVYDIEQIRDLAVSGLNSLLQCTASSNQTTGVTCNDNTTQLIDNETANDLLQLQLSVARSGVNNRCALELTSTDRKDVDRSYEDYGFEYTNSPPDAKVGLSMLPRARRSICFSLLQASVDSSRSLRWALLDNTLIKSGTKDSIFDFIRFVTMCLHGESDPRCLLQLLQLMNSSLTTFYPLLNENKNNYSNNILIISYVFEAVSPYYPVQFNPPPNDVHGLTRSMLRESVIRVLSCSLYDNTQPDDCDDNMTSLTCRLILDCLDPPEEDGPISCKEQIDVLEDLRTFLFFPFDESNTISNLEKLDIKYLEIISKGVLIVLEKASVAFFAEEMGIIRDSDTNIDVTAKNLVDRCRTLIAEIANKTERMASTDKWHVFVEKPVRSWSAQLGTSTSRASIAYMTCLASCGGFRTLSICLDVGLPPLLSFLRDRTLGTDTELVTIATYGLGAFFSSCRVAIEKAASQGIYWHPHPLEQFFNESLDFFLEYRFSPKFASNSCLQTTDVRVSSIRALNSILLVCPLHMVTTRQTVQLLDVLRQFSSTLLNAINCLSLEEPVVLNAYSQAVGTFLGLSLHFEQEDISKDHLASESNVFQLKTLRKFILDELLPSLLTSARCEITLSAKYVLRSLDTAASYSVNASSYLIQQITTTLHSCVLLGDFDVAKAMGGILGFLFEQKNHYSIHAFQNLCSPNVTAFDVIAALVPDSQVRSKSVDAFLGMSALQLPTSGEDYQEEYSEIEKGYGIIKYLLKGYEVALSKDHLLKLVAWVDQVLPPLCKSDAIMLALSLPILSAALEYSSDIESYGDLFGEKVLAMIRDLADFALAVEYHAVARSYAARCIHSTVACFTPRIGQECPVRGLIINQMFPSLRAILASPDKSKSTARSNILSPFRFQSFQENLNLFALLASAAAYRGGTSNKTADTIVYFLLDIACEKSHVIISDLEECVFDFTDLYALPNNGGAVGISVIAASAFGSILNTDCSVSILWKQRLIHLSLKRIIDYYAYSVDHVPIGLLCALSHLVCWSSVTILSATHQASILTMTTLSLSISTLQSAGPSLVRLFLASVIKLLCMVPSSIRSFYPFIVGAIRAFASVDESPDGILCKLLALQVLCLVAQISEANVNALDTVKAILPAVLSLLSTAIDHPFSAVRSAAIEVRNAWYLVRV